MRAGRSLESLLTAYRVGARVAWRRFAALGVEAGLAPDTLYLLAESIFAYIDVLSAESAEGYALEQSAAAGEAQLRRRRLVRMLVRETPRRARRRRAGGGRRRLGAAAEPGGGGDQRSPAGGRGLAPARGDDPRGDRRAHVRGGLRPRRARAARGHRAGDRRRRGPRGAGLDRRLVPGPGQLRPRTGGAGAGAARRRADHRRATTPASSCCAQIPGWPTSSPPTGWRRSTTCRRGRGGACARPWRCGWPSRAGSGASPSGSASTRRRRATGSDGCATCSATRWTTPTRGSGWRWRCGWATALSAGRRGIRTGYGGLRRRRGRRGLGGAVGLGGRDLGAERAGGDLVSPVVGDRHLVAAHVARPELDHLRAVPVAVPVGLGGDPGELGDAVAVVVVDVHRVLRGAVAQRERRDPGDVRGERRPCGTASNTT